MSDDQHKGGARPPGTTSDANLPDSHERVTSLRGASAVGVGRAFWLVVGGMALTTCAAVLVVAFVTAANDNARIERMKTHGIPVTVTVTGCTGNVGGSGSNSAGYTCRGRYVVRGVTYRELIGSLSTFAASGTTVHAVADPSKPSTVIVFSALEKTVASSGAYLRPGLLTGAWAALTVAYLRTVRRHRAVHQER